MYLPNLLKRCKHLFSYISSFAILLFAMFSGYVASPALAGATLNNMSDTLSVMTQNTTSTHSYSFQVTSTSAITSISITASSAWGSTPPTSGWVVKDAGVTKTVGSPTSSTTVITIPLTSFTPSNGDVITITNSTGWTNQASSGTYSETLNTGNETGVLAVLILAAATTNQLSISAIVGPSISLTVSGGPLTLPSGGGNMTINSATANKSAQASVQIATNAANGASITIQDANTGLLSVAAGHTIASVSAGSAAALAAEGYGMGCPTVGTGTVNTTYASTYVNAFVGNISTTAQNFWTASTAFSTTVTLQPYFNAYVTGSTQSGTYTDTATYIATAVF